MPTAFFAAFCTVGDPFFARFTVRLAPVCAAVLTEDPPDFPEEEEEPAAAAVCSFGAAAAGLDEALNFLNEDLESLFEEEVQVTKKKKKKKEAKQEHPEGFLFSSLFD